MTLINLQEDLLNFNFKKKGSIDIVGNKEHPVFTIDDSEKLEGNVYMWVTEVEGIPNEVLYIRKAGKKLIKRCKEHTQGFRRGNKNGINLLKLLNSGNKIVIHSRHSDKTKILGQDNISLCETEEKSLIQRYKDTYQLFNKL